MLNDLLGYWAPDQPVVQPQGVTGPDGTTSGTGGLGGALRSMNGGITGGLGTLSGALFKGNPMLEQMMGPQQLAQARQQAMLQAGLGMLAAGSQPGARFGGALAQGLGSGMQSYQQALGNQFAIAQHLKSLNAPIKLGEGEQLLDPRTLSVLASGQPKDNAPVAVIDPVTHQQVYTTRDKALGMAPASSAPPQDDKPLTDIAKLQDDYAHKRIDQKSYLAQLSKLNAPPSSDTPSTQLVTRPVPDGSGMVQDFAFNPKTSALEPVPGRGPYMPGTKQGPSEADKKNTVLYNSMVDAERQIQQLTRNPDGSPNPNATTTASLWNTGLGGIPVIGGTAKVLQTNAYRQYEAAGLRWAANLLYLKSGATANPDEIRSTWKQFFPQPGDGADVKAQKEQSRLQEIESTRSSMVPSAPKFQPITPAPAEAIAALKANPNLAPQFKAKYGFLPTG